MSLNVTVTPGHTFTDSETVNTAKLNAAATPTVSVSGSIDSSELGASSVDTTQLAAGAVDPSKMGESTLTPSAPGGGVTMDPSSYNKKGVILASGAINNTPTGQFEELWAGQPNSFLIGHATELDGTWTGDWSLKSKTLHANSSVYVSQQDEGSDSTPNNTFTLQVRDGSIKRDMLQGGSVSNSKLAAYSVTLDKLTPGGGAATSNTGGVAELDNSFWGGIIDFDPSDATTTTKFNGTAKVLQPTAANQVLRSTAEGVRLSFGHHPCIPKAWVNAIQTGGTFSRESTNATYTTEGNSGIDSITTTGEGVIEIVFASGTPIAVGDTVRVFGFGKPCVTSAFSVFPHAATVAEAGTGTAVKLEIKFYNKSHTAEPWVRSNELDTPSWFNLMFF
jgi:hypothetical protein